MRAIGIASDISSPTNDVYKRPPPPPPSLLLLFSPFRRPPRLPPRPHSHDPQRRATFGTTSPRCTYGEGLTSPCRRWPRDSACVYHSCSCLRARARLCTCMVDGRRSLTHRAPPGAESSSVRLAGTTRHLVVPAPSFPSAFSSPLARLFFCIFRLTPSFLAPRLPVSTCPGERRSSVNTLTRRAR